MKISRILPTAYSLQPTVSRRRRSGLTVLELVSALALFIIILGTLLVALNSATDLWTRSANSNRDMQKVRQSLDLIATDLTGAVAENKPNTPLFLVAYPPAPQNHNALYFVKTLSPAELTDSRQLSLELVSYALTPSGLSRYTRPVVASSGLPPTPPDLSAQLLRFRSAVETISSPTNIISASAVLFLPGVYLMQDAKNEAAFTSQPSTPPYPTDPNSGAYIELSELPDFVDISIAYTNAVRGATIITNYMTRRITLPTAQASRLP